MGIEFHNDRVTVTESCVVCHTVLQEEWPPAVERCASCGGMMCLTCRHAHRCRPASDEVMRKRREFERRFGISREETGR